MVSGSLLRAAMAGMALVSVAPAIAQTAASTGVPTREEIDRPDLRPTPQPRSRLTVEGDVERAPCPLAAPSYQDIRFTLREVSFNGLSVVAPETLRSAYAEFVGQTVPIATVCEIRDRAATILRQQGYLAAVQVPPQEIEDGVVRLDVLMAKLVSVQVRGDAGRSERTIAGFLDNLTAMPVFNQREAERSLLLLRDLPGYDVRLTLRPAGANPGEVIGEVTVVHTPIEVDLSIQNYGSQEVGRFGGLLRAQFNGLTGLGDRTSVGFYATSDFDEQLVVQLFHDFAIGSDGVRLAGRLTHAWASPGGNPLIDVKSRTLLAGLEASYPFVRSQSTNLYGAAGMDFVNQEIDLFDVTTNRDKLRVAYLRLDADTTDGAGGGLGLAGLAQRWRAGLSIEARKGLDILDATEFCSLCPVQPSRVPGTATGFVLRGASSLEYRPARNLAFAVGTRGQYSNDPLLAFEEFSAGNYTAGRGYDPGVIVGDSGIGMQAEVRVGSASPQAIDAFAFQGYGFVDAARVWNNRDGLSGSQHLVSAGGGLRVAYGDKARIDLTLAVPLKRLDFQTDRPDPRILLSITTRLLPWRR